MTCWAYRETEHGLKVLYRGGHLLEFTVFSENELQMARLNRYRILAEGLLAVAVRELRPLLTQFPTAAVAEVQQAIAKAKRKEANL
jgi:hypothetical protein